MFDAPSWNPRPALERLRRRAGRLGHLGVASGQEPASFPDPCHHERIHDRVLRWVKNAGREATANTPNHSPIPFVHWSLASQPEGPKLGAFCLVVRESQTKTKGERGCVRASMCVCASPKPAKELGRFCNPKIQHPNHKSHTPQIKTPLHKQPPHDGLLATSILSTQSLVRTSRHKSPAGAMFSCARI